jgi:hypothetical protein
VINKKNNTDTNSRLLSKVNLDKLEKDLLKKGKELFENINWGLSSN